MFSSSVYRLIRGAGVSILAALSFAIAPAQAQSVADFYKGKTINLVIGFSSGSGYDIYARMLARHMPKHIPGNPSIVPQNMPGAGSLRAAQYVANVAPKDGTVLGAIGRSLPVEPLLGDVKLDGRHFAWIGNIASSNSLCASWHETAIKNWNDLITKPVVLAGQGPGSDLDNFALVLKNVFGAKVKLVSGYPGGNDANMAIERRETDGRCGWSWDSIKSTKPDWLRDKKINLLVVFAMEKASDLPPEVPMILEKARNDEERQILQLHLAGQAFGRPFFAAAEIPADRKAALRAAFDATMKDPEFIAEAARIQLDVIPSTGAEIDRIMAEIYSTPKHIVEKARLALKN
jgi:tripartite-type tricarboxylate transporter receptor subunit TctC